MKNKVLNENRKNTIILIFTSLTILLPSLLLLAATSWNSDDYYVAYLYQNEGWHGLYHRIFNWSPRFFSEIILYFYYNTVLKLGKPFTGCMILIMWLVMSGAIFIFIRNTIKKNSLLFLDNKQLIIDNKVDNKGNNKSENIDLNFLLPLLVTLIIFTYCLYSNRSRPSPMYYLVVVSVAYLPTLAGIILNLNFFINQANSSNISKGNIFQLILFGVITSSSWEMGTVYQLFFSSCLFLLLLLSIFSTKFNYLAFSRLTKSDRWKLSIANLIPFAFSLYILFLLQASRLTIVEDSSVASPLARDFNASFIATILQFFKELFFGGGNNISFYDFTYSLIYKLGFLLLLMIFFYQAKIKFNFLTINACLISIVPLLITNFVITFSGYYQLGINSYPRQISFKVALIGLTIVIIALMLASLCSSLSNQLNIKNININALMSSPLTLLISFCLTFTLLINFQFDNLKRDLLNFNNILISNHQNWQRNLHSSQSLAVYTQVPSHYIFRMSFEPGLYPACDHPDNGRPVRYMNYFHKQKLYVTPFSNKAFSDEEIEEQLVRVSQEMKNRKNKIDFACSFTPGNAKLVLGNVEQINQLTSLDQIIEVNIDDTVEIYGWAMNPDNSPPEKIIITLENNENLLVDQTLDIPRPDIAKHFGNPSLLNSGWKATFSPKPEWNGQTLTFIVWAYNPDTKIANFAKDFTIRFSSSKQN